MTRISFPSYQLVPFLCLLFVGIGQSNGQFVVNAQATEISCNCFRLTDNTTDQHGSVWNQNQLDLTEPFEMTFRVYLGDSDGWGADGMSFVLQQGTGSTALPHGNPGHQFITPSIAVEIDQFMDPADNDPGDDHVAIMANGSYDHSSAENLAGPIDAVLFGGNIDNGSEHDLRVSWDPGAQQLSVNLDIMIVPLLVHTGDIVTDIFGGDPMVHWGFTGGTGGIPSEHRFCFDLDGNASASVASICAGEEVQFTASATSSLSEIQAYNWDFNNGQTSSEMSPSMVFDTVGIYSIVQTASDISGCEVENIITVTVEPAPEVNVELTSGCEGEPLTLTNLTTGAQNYQWSFSDGQSSTDAQPSITMANGGLQSFTLVAASGANCMDSTTATFYVNPVPNIALTVDDHCLGEEVPYVLDIPISVGQIDSVHWNMDDGITYTDTLIAHTYQVSGNYSVILEAFSDSGCSDMISVDVQVLGTMPELIQNGETISVDNGPFTAYQWYINGTPVDGATGTTFTPGQSGNISVVTTDNNGCAAPSLNLEFTSSIGISDPEGPAIISVSPNPNSGVFTLEAVFTRNLNSRISVKDVCGREIMEPIHVPSVDSFQRTINLQGMGSGTYFLSLSTEEGMVVLSFVVTGR